MTITSDAPPLADSSRPIDATSTLSQLVIDVPARSRVFETLGMDFCCGGGVSLAEACADKQVDVADVVELLEGIDKIAGDERDWSSAPLGELARHIVDTHHARLAEELPHVQMLVAKVARAHGARREGLVEARVVFDQMAAALREHTDAEERDVFPLLDPLPEGAAERESLRELVGRMTDDHDEVTALFERLHELLDDFATPEDACTSHRAMLDGLIRLERDLHLHVHQENHILFPRALEQLTTA